MAVVKGKKKKSTITPCRYDNYAQGPVWKQGMTQFQLLLLDLHGFDMVVPSRDLPTSREIKMSVGSMGYNWLN